MPYLYLAVRTKRGQAAIREAFLGLPDSLAEPLISPVYLALATTQAINLFSLRVDPATATLTAKAAPEALHYLRWADATLKPLPPTPPPLTLQRGDAYIALSPGVRAVADSPAVARFLHLRDYFNAARLAGALLAQLIPAGTIPPEDVSVVVVEAR